MGSLTGFAHGSAKASDPAAQGTLRLQEEVIKHAHSLLLMRCMRSAAKLTAGHMQGNDAR